MGDDALAKYPGLYSRGNGAWYVRKRVPVDLVGLEKRFQLRFSLETTDMKTAKRRYASKLAEIEAHFEALRNRLQSMGAIDAAIRVGKLERLNEGQIESIVVEWWRRREADRGAATEHPFATEDVVSRMESGTLPTSREQVNGDNVKSIADKLLKEAGFPARPHRVGAIATHVEYPALDRDARNYRRLCEVVARAMVIETALAQDRLLSRHDAPYDSLFNPDQAAQGRGVRARGKRLADLFRDYSAERATVHGEHSTEKRYGFAFRVMEEVLGREKLVSALTRADCVKVLGFLKRIPPNPTKRFPKLSLTQIVAKAEAENLPRLAPNSVATYMQALSAALRWAKDAGWDVSVNLRDLVGTREAIIKRRGFRPEELEVLFASLEPLRWTEPAKFWVPALALFTGARAGEICQLRVADVSEVEGVPCLNLSLFDATGRRSDDKRLKTKASERYVPLHPALLEGGFVAFARAGKPNDRLFPTLEQGPDGRYSHGFSKWFGRHKKRVGFDEPGLVFHSFRHGFRDACRRAEINEETAQALGGWASESQAARYGDRGMVTVLDNAIRKLSFGGFRLPTGQQSAG